MNPFIPLIRTCLLLCALLFAVNAQGDEDEILPPEQAFRSSAKLVDTDTVEVRYAIAEGYYLYRDKFRFESRTGGIQAGTPRLPPGKLKHDEFFGTVQTYRGDVVIRVPITGALSHDTLTLQTQFQGCADAGICYTPQTRLSTVQLAMAQSDTTSDTGGALSRLKQPDAPAPVAQAKPVRDPLQERATKAVSAQTDPAKAEPAQNEEGEEDFLPVEQAFRVKLRARDASTLEAEFSPQPSYYLYRDKTGIAIVQGTGIAIDRIDLPRGERKSDPNFGDTEVFHRPFTAVATLKRTGTAAQTVAVDVRFQGCSEKGLCYPPTTQRLRVALPAVTGAAGVAIETPASPESGAPVVQSAAVPAIAAAGSSSTSPAPPAETSGAVSSDTQDETSSITRMLRETSFWGVVASFFGFGLLLALTPCVFPMIPILSGIIVGQGKDITRTRALGLSSIYVLGMAITYAIAGVAAGLSGALLTSALQNPWVLGTFALVFVALALSMFGYYDLQMPAWLQSRLTDVSNRQRSGTAGGVFVMGVLSALIVGPCVAAPLAGALVYISQTRDVVLGGSALFAMALGMGAPLLLVGWSAGSLLPRAGAWMQTVKNFFGVLLLAVALWLVSPVIPAVAQMLGWAALLICSAVYLHALDPLPPHTSGLRKLWKGVGVIALLVGVALLIGALAGGRDPLQPLAGLRAANSAQPAAHGPAFERVTSLAQLEQRIASAGGRPVMLDFYADWCVSCKEMERFTFSDPSVQAQMRQFVLLQADVTRNSAEDDALLKRFGLFGPPGIIFFDAQGQEQRARVVGFQPPEKFSQALARALR